jgi:selenoprotein W-related protein
MAITKIRIEYCGRCNFRPRAASLADTLKRKCGLDAELVEGSGGVFQVWADDQLLWDKQARNDAFPNEAAMIDEVERLRSGT